MFAKIQICINIGNTTHFLIGIIFKAIDDMWELDEWRIFGIVISSLVTIAGIVLLILSFIPLGLGLLLAGVLVLLGLIFWIIIENRPYNDEMYLSYEEYTVEELKDICRIRGISGYSKLRKSELIDLLERDDNNDVDWEKPQNNTNQDKKFANLKSPIKKDNGIMLDDIAGLDAAKEEIIERVIMPIKHKDLFEKFGKKIGGGILLYGLPGTGKTMFAKAVANELDADFYEIKCSDIMSKWYGESEQNIKVLFKKARSSKMSVIFFDEFDAIGKKRSNDDIDSVNIVPELLAQLQGFEQSRNIIIPLAATNRPWDIDTALLRPGRFDVKIHIPLPDYKARLFIIQKELRAIKFEDEDLVNTIANMTERFNGADVVEFCEQIKMVVIHKSINKIDEVITKEDIQKIKEKVKSSVSSGDINAINEFLERY